MADELVPNSPLWWVHRLEAQLVRRRREVKRLDDYYRGEHPLPTAPEKAKEAFRRLLLQSRSNWMGLVVDAVGERLRVTGFRLGQDQPGDAEAWRIWQANGLDAESEMVHTEALVAGEAYVSVWANPADPDRALVTPERPTQLAVAYAPGSRRHLLAALKVWHDELEGVDFATLYRPAGIWKYRSPRGFQASGDVELEAVAPGRWLERSVPDEPWPLPNPLRIVPVVPFRNRARLGADGVSEIADVISTQDRINTTLFNRLMAAEFSAFRQRWVTGMDIPVDEHGRQVEPFRAAIDRLWMAEDPGVHFGEFSQTNLDGYISSVEADIQHIAAQTRTPPHYLLGQSGNIPSGESLKSTETGLVAKVRRRQVHFGEAWEDVLRLAFLVEGDDRRASVTSSEAIWQDPEARTEGELVDALLKMKSLNVPDEVLWERWGASPQEITRWKELQPAQAPAPPAQ